RRLAQPQRPPIRESLHPHRVLPDIPLPAVRMGRPGYGMRPAPSEVLARLAGGAVPPPAPPPPPPPPPPPLVPVLPGVFAQFAPHLLHPASDAPGVALVEVAELAGVGQGIQPVVLGPDRSESGEEAREPRPTTARTPGWGRVRDPHHEETHP